MRPFSPQHGMKLNVVLTAISGLIYLMLTGYFLANDFWQDEIYTIDHFVFQSWKTVFTDYHSTNNHIAFNGIVKLLITILDINQVKTVMIYPWIIRLVPYCFSLLSLVILYRAAKNYYGRDVALIATSVLGTSIVFVGFGAQLRGYSFTILLSTIQYFSFLQLLKGVKTSRSAVVLFSATLLNLICLPTNFYLVVSYLSYCVIVLLVPKLNQKLFDVNSLRKNIVFAGIILVLTSFVALIYYQWLLSLQPPNPLLTSVDHFDVENIVQSLSIFYHFTGYRVYFYVILFVWAVVYQSRSKKNPSSKVLFPALLFFCSFIVFFIHGAVVIQRTFLSLLPFFALIIATSFVELKKAWKFPGMMNLLLIGNIMCLVISFFVLVDNSEKNNERSTPLTDLVDHYYLINFNASEATIVAQNIITTNQVPLYVWDDFGKTGIEYYLKHFSVPFQWYQNHNDLHKKILVLTNNKREFEQEIYKMKIPFKRILNYNRHYCLYLLNRTDDNRTN